MFSLLCNYQLPITRWPCQSRAPVCTSLCLCTLLTLHVQIAGERGRGWKTDEGEDVWACFPACPLKAPCVNAWWWLLVDCAVALESAECELILSRLDVLAGPWPVLWALRYAGGLADADRTVLSYGDLSMLGGVSYRYLLHCIRILCISFAEAGAFKVVSLLP